MLKCIICYSMVSGVHIAVAEIYHITGGIMSGYVMRAEDILQGEVIEV